jgi:hypothetical protein
MFSSENHSCLKQPVRERPDHYIRVDRRRLSASKTAGHWAQPPSIAAVISDLEMRGAPSPSSSVSATRFTNTTVRFGIGRLDVIAMSLSVRDVAFMESGQRLLPEELPLDEKRFAVKQ